MNKNNNKEPIDDPGPWGSDFIYSIVLFLVAVGAIAYTSQTHGILLGDYGLTTAAFFVVFGLFTITTGFPHPGFGHVSFDRVAQVASILVLGPVDAAWINGLASFIYPWHRLRNGADLRQVITAACNNAGLMTLVILICGSLYEYLGGPIPLVSLDLRIGGLLLLLMLSMQFINDLGMMVILYLRGISPTSILNSFTTAVESVSVLIAVVVALAFTTSDRVYFALLLVVLGIGMLVLKQYALMRQRLEALVDERTEALHLKSIELDEVLRRIAQILLNRCRKTDVVARYGGEEFLLCFPDTDARFAEQICSQMRQAIEHADWSDLQVPGGEEIKVTISFGVAESSDDSRRTTILGDADARLYRAKHQGRNRIIARD
mgnify:CR=1 FL=1